MGRVLGSFDTSALQKKVKRVPDMIEKEMNAIAEQEARLFLKEVVKWTPPAHAGVTGLKAKKAGELAVFKDVRKLYAPPAAAYAAIKEVDPRLAAAFQRLRKEGNYQAAADILNKVGNRTFLKTRSFGPFDGGQIHRKFRGSRGKVKAGSVILVVTDPKELEKYIKLMQNQVGILAAGWNAAAKKMGVSLPAWVARHGSANGDIDFEIGAGKFVIVIRNQVRFGSAQDLQRRTNDVLAIRRNKRERRLKGALEASIKKAGL